jgi:hypothetical protein
MTVLVVNPYLSERGLYYLPTCSMGTAPAPRPVSKAGSIFRVVPGPRPFHMVVARGAAFLDLIVADLWGPMLMLACKMTWAR